MVPSADLSSLAPRMEYAPYSYVVQRFVALGITDSRAAAARTAVNLLLAPLLAYGGRLWEMLYLFAGTQLVLGLFNLLPILPLDGGSMLWNLLAWVTEPYTADRVMTAVGFGTAAVLTLAAIWAAWQGGGFFFLLASLGLLWQPLP